MTQPTDIRRAFRPRLLDLFCCQGGASKGYADAGFEVTGVDITAQPRYPYAFHQTDALTFPLDGFDLVHASWPCQAYARVTAWRGSRETHPDLLAPGRARLEASGLPWVIENVPETSWGGGGELLPPCWHRNDLLVFAHKGERAYADAMGCTWMTNREARQAVPPAYTQWIGEQFLTLEGRVAA